MKLKAFHWTFEKKISQKYSKNPNVIKDYFTWGSSEQILPPTSLSYENENNPKNSCDSQEVGIAQAQPIFHHLVHC